uniref:Protein Wnt n=1 Tax=Megaselia scalaris TaxID=36166 RepID=T1GWS8_MEGSC
MQELKEKINKEILNSALVNSGGGKMSDRRRKQNMQNDSPMEENASSTSSSQSAPRLKNGLSAKARSLMNLHNNEAGRRAVLRKSKILCKCHGVSGSCSLITCWQQLSSIREIGDYLREKYEGAIEVKLNKRGQLQVRHEEYKVQTPHDLVYLDDSPDWCRVNKQLQWPGTHGRECNKTSSGLDGCGILCCGRGYNTKTITVVERCNCKFHWCCQVKCETCVKVREEHTCK